MYLLFQPVTLSFIFTLISGNKPDDNSLNMVTMVNDVSTTTESPPHPLLGDEDDDDQVDQREADEEEATPAFPVGDRDRDEEEGLIDYSEHNSVDSTEIHTLTRYDNEDKSQQISSSIESSLDCDEVGSSSVGLEFGEKESRNMKETPSPSSSATGIMTEKSASFDVYSNLSSTGSVTTAYCSEKAIDSSVSKLDKVKGVTVSSVCQDSSSATLHSVVSEEEESLDVCSTDGLDNFVIGYSGVLHSNSAPEQSYVMDLSSKSCQEKIGIPAVMSEAQSSSMVICQTAALGIGPDYKARLAEKVTESNMTTRSKRLRQAATVTNPDSSSSDLPSEIPLMETEKFLPKAVKRTYEMDFIGQDGECLCPSLCKFLYISNGKLL